MPGTTPGPDGCVFDPIIARTAPAEIVLDEAEIIAFLDVRPLFPGHTLVVPRLHVATLSELPGELAGPLLAAGARVARALETAVGAQGAFLALNNVVSQSVPHVHLHVVPRRSGDGLRGFFWPRQRYAEGQMADVGASLRSALARS